MTSSAQDYAHRRNLMGQVGQMPLQNFLYLRIDFVTELKGTNKKKWREIEEKGCVCVYIYILRTSLNHFFPLSKLTPS